MKIVCYYMNFRKNKITHNHISRGILVVLLFLSYTAFPQINGKFTRFDLENGLSDNFVSSVVQDNFGFLWVGTKNGLNKFDGYSFKKFPFELINSIVKSERTGHFRQAAFDVGNRLLPLLQFDFCG